MGRSGKVGALSILAALVGGSEGFVFRPPQLSSTSTHIHSHSHSHSNGYNTRLHMSTSTDNKAVKKVIIAGGGIGGLVLANALQANGIGFELYEKTKEYRPFGGPIQVQSNALAALEAINDDMCKEVMAAGTTTGNRVNGLKDGVTNEWYCQFDTGAPARREGLPLTRVVDRPDLQAILLKYIDQSHLHKGTEVVDFEDKGDHVEVTLSDGTKDTADVLVGADGIWSLVRARLHQDQPGKESAVYSGYTCYTGVCECRPEDVNEVAYKVYLAKGKYFVCSDVGKGRMQWYAMLGLPPGSEADGPQVPYLLKEYEGWSHEVRELLQITKEEDVTQRDLYDRRPAVLKGWVKGLTAILGDAAHPMMPNLGQGGCQAVEDAYRLAKELSKATTRSEIPWALKSYEANRLVRSSAVTGLARVASDVLFISGNLFTNPLIQRVAGLGMSITMPLILTFLYQNTLDNTDWKFTQQRLGNQALYEESDAMYKSVSEAAKALRERAAKKQREMVGTN